VVENGGGRETSQKKKRTKPNDINSEPCTGLQNNLAPVAIFFVSFENHRFSCFSIHREARSFRVHLVRDKEIGNLHTE
jgi:hypothetical protein